MVENTELKNPEQSTYFKHDKYIFNNLLTDLFSYLLILIVLLGSGHMYYSIDDLMHEVKENRKDYYFPSYIDLLPSLIYLLIMIIAHELFRYCFAHRMEKYLSKKYFSEDKVLIEIYKNKVTTNIYKFLFYFASTIFGFIVLKDLNFFPWSLMGKGDFKNLFKGGYPNFFYFDKPQNFDLYYNLNLSFALFDGYLLLANPLQSDFLFMVLHHLSTYSLIIFSYITNFSQVGSMVYFSHYFGDVFSYIVRVALHLNVPDFIPFITTLVFLIVFYYTRLFVYCDLLYNIYIGLDYTWTSIESNLVGFSVIILLLNILWMVLITRKFIKFCFTRNIEEIYKFKVNKKKAQ